MRGIDPAVVSAFVLWPASFIRFHGIRHPETLGGAEVGAFLTHLALDTDGSPPRQALPYLPREFPHPTSAPSR